MPVTRSSSARSFGLRYSSTGVPTATMTWRARAMSRGLRRECQPIVAKGGRQERLGAVLDERHRPALDRVHRGPIQIEDEHALAGTGEDERQRQADVAGAADDADVEVAW